MTRERHRTPAVLLGLALLLPFAVDRGAFERASAAWLMQLFCDCDSPDEAATPPSGCCQDEEQAPEGPKASSSDASDCCCTVAPISEGHPKPPPLERSASSPTHDSLRWLNCGADVSARAPTVLAHGELGERNPPGWLDPPGSPAPEGAAACSPFAARRLSASGAERAATSPRL